MLIMALPNLQQHCKNKEISTIKGYWRQRRMSNSKQPGIDVIATIHNFCFPFFKMMVNTTDVCIDSKTENKMISNPKSNTFIEGPYAISITGAPTAGKTCLIMRRYGEFGGLDVNQCTAFEYIPTCRMDSTFKNLQIDSQRISFVRVCEGLTYSNTDIMICMSIFDDLTYTMHDVLTDAQMYTLALCQQIQSQTNTPCILIGTKIDLRNNVGHKHQCYSKQEMEYFAYQCGCSCYDYNECSALYNNHCWETFRKVMVDSVAFRKSANTSKPRKCCIQ
eukprot:598633_1